MRLLILLLPMILFGEGASIKQLFNVTTTKVKKLKSAHTKKSYGYVKIDESRIYHVAPRFGGFVEQLYADKIYKKVKRGEPLAVVYSPEVYKAKEEYLKSYSYTRGKSTNGMLKSAKLKLLLLGVSQKEITQLLKDKKVSLNTTIYSPADGYIYSKTITNGSAFFAKNRLFEIVDLSSVWVEAKVFEEDLAFFNSAKSFEISFKTTKKIYRATTALLYPKIEEKETLLSMRLTLQNSDNKLFEGMYATILTRDKEQEYLVLPQSAVIRTNGKFYVFMVSEFKGEYEPIEVSVEVLDTESYLIKSGLVAGDEVVNNALFMMDSDAQINGLY